MIGETRDEDCDMKQHSWIAPLWGMGIGLCIVATAIGAGHPIGLALLFASIALQARDRHHRA
jgi:hypothetical protein